MECSARERIVRMVLSIVESLIEKGKLRRRKNGKISAFISDTDGTVGKWQLLIGLLMFIGETFSERKPLVEPLEEVVYGYHQGRLPFGMVIEQALAILPKAIRGLHIEIIRHLAIEVAQRYRDRVYQYPKAVLTTLSSLEAEDRRLILSITGAPQLIADPFCSALNFDIAIGCDYYLDKLGRFTGERDETPAIRKNEVLTVLAEDCGIDLDDSMGMGDTMSDLPIFLAVNPRYRWAINPKAELLTTMRGNPGYNIVCFHDHHATGVQVLKCDENGRLHEIKRGEYLPPELVRALPLLPGERPDEV